MLSSASSGWARGLRATLSGERLGRAFCGVLIAFSVVILGAYWINRALTMQQQEAATLNEAQRRAEALVLAVSEQTRGTVHSIDLTLLYLAHLHSMNRGLSEHDVQSVRAVAPAGLVRRVTLIDAAGTVRMTFPAGGAGIVLSDRPHFLAHVGGKVSGLYIGRPIQSRIDPNWLIPLSRRLVDSNGKFAGVIAIMVAPEHFSELYAKLATARDDVIALTLTDGTFLSRSNNLADHIGKSARADRPFVGERAPPAGVFRSVSTFEPVERIFAYRRLADWPLVTVVGLGVAEALTAVRARQAADRNSALTVSMLIALLATGICIVVFRLERSLVQARESNARRAMAFAGASELAWEWDMSARRVRFFGNCQPFFGGAFDEHSVSIEDWMHRVHPDDQQAVRQQAKSFLLAESVALDSRYRFQFADGHYRWVLVRGRPVLAPDGQRRNRAIGVLMDVDADRKAEIASAQTREAYRSLIESTSEGILVVDQEGVIQLFNPAAERLLGWSASEVIGREAGPLLTDAPKFSANECPVLATLRDNRSRRGVRLIYRHKSGRPVPVEIGVAPITLEGSAEGAVALIVDVSRQIAYEAELERLARTDGLSGLWSRRYFVEVFIRELKRAERDLTPLSLLMIDIDHFKAINDHYGHAAGDTVLVALADFFRAQLREVDIIGRLGGEEFGIGLPGIALDEARQVAERLRAGMEALDMQVGESHVHCTISLGVGVWNGKESFDALLGRADKALYEAKEGGRNRVV